MGAATLAGLAALAVIVGIVLILGARGLLCYLVGRRWVRSLPVKRHHDEKHHDVSR